MAVSMDRDTVAIYAGAVVIRLIVFLIWPNLSDFLTAQVEISTPISSFKRLQEGLFLYRHGLSPYDGGVFHQAPLLLVVFDILPAPLVFIALDTVNGLALHTIADKLRIPSPRFRNLSGSLIAAAYLFNPLTILSCLGKSTTIFTNTAIIQAVLNAQAGNRVRAMFGLAVGSYLSMYPALLLPPVLLMAHKSSPQSWSALVASIASYFGVLGALLGSTPVITSGFWDFLSSCYGAQITVTDLTPNVGLWWYFFIEIFDSFRDFFIGVFWLQLVGYVGAMTFRLQAQPLFVITSLVGLFAVFKPYPSIADVSLYLGLLPLYQHILPLTRYVFIAASVLLYSTLLGPAFYHLWIYAGSGNANFFYAITLVWSLGLTILVGDTLFAVMRDEWEIERPEMKGKSARQI
ncbi:phosphatidylinositol glycan, class U [Exophiala aquamarina CBS 119918]|uniref:Phosphatidylinositol glycan, class U n=1 Tax=Exophiala aquamarina CBS 119918 TaxID=1182545 RepID=A0A072Q5H2_9EURO|nr:phosphatidylinositol glycan, class U [Exophiala aquamarina CBS 119918]KEF63180.1 phosphatidylinositol glycan, class U [Exophiala aquamarina CBS 119918]